MTKYRTLTNRVSQLARQRGDKSRPPVHFCVRRPTDPAGEALVFDLASQLGAGPAFLGARLLSLLCKPSNKSV